MNNKKPSHTIRCGLVKAAIWDNSNGESQRHKVTFGKLYKDGDTWKVGESFGRDDLLYLAKAADQAHSWICDRAQARPG